MKKFWLIIVLAFLLAGGVKAQTSVFTYQGKLTEGGAAANGNYDLQFKLYDLPTAGTLHGTLTRDDVIVTSGIFTVQLDYGASVFQTNSGRYLEIGVRPGASTGAFTMILPRQELTAAPYAVQTLKAADADNLGNQPPSAYLRSNISQSFTGGNLTIDAASNLVVNGGLFGNGFSLFGLNAGNISFGTLSDARLSSNIPRLNAYNIFTGGVQFNQPPIGSGEFLTNLGASNIASGTLNDARLSANIPRLNVGNTFSAANNNFAGQISANSLSIGGGLPITKILTASATLDFGNGGIFQEVRNINVVGARAGDAVFLGTPANVFPFASHPTTGTTITEPLIFQAFVSSPDTVSVVFVPNIFPIGDINGGGPPNCLGGNYACQDPPPGVFRVVVFSFAP